MEQSRLLSEPIHKLPRKWSVVKTSPESGGKSDIRPVTLVGHDVRQIGEDARVHLRRGEPVEMNLLRFIYSSDFVVRLCS
jgi:hypothetical protein